MLQLFAKLTGNRDYDLLETSEKSQKIGKNYIILMTQDSVSPLPFPSKKDQPLRPTGKSKNLPRLRDEGIWLIAEQYLSKPLIDLLCEIDFSNEENKKWFELLFRPVAISRYKNKNFVIEAKKVIQGINIKFMGFGTISHTFSL